MKILLLSEEGELLSLGMRLKKHDVAMYIDNSLFSLRGKGILPIESSPDVTLSYKRKRYSRYLADLLHKYTPELVILEKAFGYLEKAGIQTWGANEWSMLLNGNAEYREEIKKLLPLEDFNGDAYGFLWNGEPSLLHTIELTPGFMPGNVGPQVISSVKVDIKKEHGEEKLSMLYALLRKNDYKGFVYVNKRDLFLGYDYSLASSLTEKVVDPIHMLLPQNGSQLLHHTGTAKSLLLSLSPYPSGLFSPSLLPVELSPEMLKHLSLLDIAQDQGAFHLGVTNGLLGYITTYGSYGELSRRLQRTAKNLLTLVASLQYRIDI